MPDMQTLYDEESPAGKPSYPERGRMLGTPEGVDMPPLDGRYDVIGGFYLPTADKREYGVSAAQASPRAFFGDEWQAIAPIKYADESMHYQDITFAPVVGEESQIHLINQQAYNQMAGPKGPLSRRTDHPTTANLVSNLATSPGYELASSEAEMLSLVGGF